MAYTRKDKKAKDMYSLYCKGFSLAKVAEAFCVTRQSIYKMFKRRNFILRTPKNPLPFIMFNGKKYTLRNTGYYGCTNGHRSLFHRDVWEYHNGSIPEGYDIHHLDRDRTNNHISNLELIIKSEHSKRYNTGKNQYSKKD